MLKKTITYIDFNGQTRTEDHYFNLTEAEAMEMELTTTGGMVQMMESIIAAQDVPSIIKVFKELILKSYGKKGPDGRRLIKSEEISKEFSETNAYSKLFMELGTDAKKAAAFFDGVISKKPKEMVNAPKKKPEGMTDAPNNSSGSGDVGRE